MNFEPQKFFIGLVDFFSILLPGALLTYLLKDAAGPLILGDGYQRLSGTEAGLVFLFSSYLLGHFIFLIGAKLLDDLYDALRNATYEGQIRQLAKGERLSNGLYRWLANSFFNTTTEEAVKLAGLIRQHYLNPLGAAAAINTYQWSKARLTLEKPDVMESIHRLEADQKFFRSLFVVLCLLIPAGVMIGRPAITLASLVLLGLAFWRYVDQRVKAINQAYWYNITLESQREGGFRQATQPQAQAGGLSHAGGVVFRQRHNQTEYLLIQAKTPEQEWILPKGHIEPGESAAHAAVREVREETGHWARVMAWLEDVPLGSAAGEALTRFHLMACVEEGKGPNPEGRGQQWLSISAAIQQAAYPETRKLLDKAHARRMIDD